MKMNYTPALKKGQQHQIYINGESLRTTIGTDILEFARPLITYQEFKELKEAVRLRKELVINDSTTFSDFEKDLHLFITSHPYYQQHGEMMNQKMNEKMQLRYSFKPDQEGGKKMVISVKESLF